MSTYSYSNRIEMLYIVTFCYYFILIVIIMAPPLIYYSDFMLKTLFGFCFIVAGCGLYYFNSSLMSVSYEGNTHTSAVQRFWYEQKELLTEGNKIDLPLVTNVKTLDYYIGESSIESGTYYFKTILVVNGQEMRVETAVKPNEGIWEVDIKETFMLAHKSTLDHYLYSYLSSQKALNSNLKNEYIWGMGGSYTTQNEEHLKNILSERFDMVKEEILNTYRE
jgi:hypothetical protein